MLSHLPDHFVLDWRSPHLAHFPAATPNATASTDSDASARPSVTGTGVTVGAGSPAVASSEDDRRGGHAGHAGDRAALGTIGERSLFESGMDAYLDSDFFPLNSLQMVLSSGGPNALPLPYEISREPSGSSNTSASTSSSKISSPERDGGMARISSEYLTTTGQASGAGMGDMMASWQGMKGVGAVSRNQTIVGSFRAAASSTPSHAALLSPANPASMSQTPRVSPPNATSTQVSEKATQRCHTCKARRLVCDQAMPGCKKCASRGVECPGYGQNLRWVQPEQKAAKAAAPLMTGKAGSQKRARGRPRLQLMEVKEEDEDGVLSNEGWQMSEGIRNSRRWAEKVMAIQSHHLKKPLLPEEYHRNKFMLEHLRYHNNYMITDLGVVQSTASVHVIPLQVWSYIPSYLMSTLIATGTTHQIIRSQTPAQVIATRRHSRNLRDGNIYKRLQSFMHPRMPIVFEYFQKSIRDVNAIIKESPDLVFRRVKGLDGADLMFAAISGLMLSELQQTAFTTWKNHFNALYLMLKKRGGFHMTAEAAQPRTLYLLNTYMIVDTMRRVTTTSQTLAAEPDDQPSYIAHLPVVYQDGLETGTPSPTPCFAYLIQTNILRRRWAIFHAQSTASSHDPSPTPQNLAALREETTQALRALREFDAQDWAKTRKPDYEQMLLRRADILEKRVQVQEELDGGPGMEDWVDFAVVFQLANIVYGLRSTIIDQGTPDWLGSPDFATGLGLSPHESALTLLSTTFRSLILVLHRIQQRAKNNKTAAEISSDASAAGRETPKSSEWPWRFTFWPLFVACMESTCSGDFQEEREWMVQSIFEIGIRQTDFCTLDGADFFEMVWEEEAREGKSGGRSWDEVMRAIDGKGLFFI